ncbi:hypothetical protein VP01_1026g1 [Puccinia sorghi]|uniref:Uncharacterized protein n=1 Tax=Puccinia sorghi TaxID=27349 RepID=A0A0L6VV26_9BASI|nr:hypothetical protein VP01_1026g1 [Puccinia sorghi]
MKETQASDQAVCTHRSHRGFTRFDNPLITTHLVCHSQSIEHIYLTTSWKKKDLVNKNKHEEDWVCNVIPLKSIFYHSWSHFPTHSNSARPSPRLAYTCIYRRLASLFYVGLDSSFFFWIASDSHVRFSCIIFENTECLNVPFNVSIIMKNHTTGCNVGMKVCPRHAFKTFLDVCCGILKCSKKKKKSFILFIFSFSIFFPISHTTGQKSQILMEEMESTTHFNSWSPWMATSQTPWIRSYTPLRAAIITHITNNMHTIQQSPHTLNHMYIVFCQNNEFSLGSRCSAVLVCSFLSIPVQINLPESPHLDRNQQVPVIRLMGFQITTQFSVIVKVIRCQIWKTRYSIISLSGSIFSFVLLLILFLQSSFSFHFSLSRSSRQFPIFFLSQKSTYFPYLSLFVAAHSSLDPRSALFYSVLFVLVCSTRLFQASTNASFWLNPLNDEGQPKSLTLVYVSLYLFCHSPFLTRSWNQILHISLLFYNYINPHIFYHTLSKSFISSLVQVLVKTRSNSACSHTSHLITHYSSCITTHHHSSLITHNPSLSTHLCSIPTLINNLSSTIQHPF